MCALYACADMLLCETAFEAICTMLAPFLQHAMIISCDSHMITATPGSPPYTHPTPPLADRPQQRGPAEDERAAAAAGG